MLMFNQTSMFYSYYGKDTEPEIRLVGTMSRFEV